MDFPAAAAGEGLLIRLFYVDPIQVDRWFIYCSDLNWRFLSAGNSNPDMAKKFVGQVESEFHPGLDHVMMSLLIRVTNLNQEFCSDMAINGQHVRCCG